MPQITGIVTNNDTTLTIDYVGNVSNKKQTFYFDDRQDGMTIKNEDSVILTLILNGRSYTLTAKQSLDISERFISFNIVSKSAGTSKFSLTSYIFHSGTPSVIEDVLTSTNPRNGLSANQGRVLNDKIITTTLKSFGAVGDGIADDTTPIKNAINSMINGGILQFEYGKTYKVSSLMSFTNMKNLIIDGLGAKIKCSSSFGDMLKFVNGSNIHVRNLEVEGAEMNLLTTSKPLDQSNLILFQNADNVSVQNCSLHNTLGNCASAIDCTNVFFINNKIYEMNEHGIWTLRCDTVLVESNRITGIRNSGGTMPIGTSSEVPRGGIGYLGTRGNNITVRRNTIKSITDTGTKTEGANNVIYDNNYVEDCGKDGIKVQDYQTNLSGLTNWFYGNPDYRVTNAKIINNTVKNLYAWRSDGSSLIQIHNCAEGEVRGNIVHGGIKPLTVTDLNSVVKNCEENAIRTQYCVDVVVDGHIEGTSTITDSYYFNNNQNVKLINSVFKTYGKWIDHNGNDFISNNEIGADPSNVNSAFQSINPKNILLHNNRIAGAVLIQPSVNTKSIRIKNNEIIQNFTNDTLTIQNFQTSNGSVENLEITENMIKVVGTITTGRIIRISCDKVPYKIARITGNTVDRNGQTTLPLVTILSDASGNSFKITDLLTGQNFPAYVHSGGNATSVTTNTTL